eukprot:gnl/Chilomastix_cuspidata/7160.p1 GENE.gnl/Chilomastix_cuspidata/7160~~gnl/Chilomastix_cuspidata/7160.p1  ORF type:complete len:157 (-),score=3.53 gnl/Chilomastix_cuspidata/7160:10-426(-)
MIVDLTTHTSRLVDVKQWLPSISGFVGIYVPDAAWIACAGKNRPNDPVFVVTFDGTMLELAKGIGAFPIVLLSAADPSNLARAAIIDWSGKFYMEGAKKELRNTTKIWCRSLVRLFRDVFLCWDRDRAAWLITQISVP